MKPYGIRSGEGLTVSVSRSGLEEDCFDVSGSAASGGFWDDVSVSQDSRGRLCGLSTTSDSLDWRLSYSWAQPHFKEGM